MSTSASTQPRASLSPRHFSRLSAILTEANAHYRTVAAAARAAKRPTYHARMRAYKLGLGVDIQRAVNCPEEHVSAIPLPIIDTTPSPPPRQQRPRPNLRVVVPGPAPRAAADVPISTGSYSTLSLSTGSIVPPIVGPFAPIPMAAAPTVLRGQQVPWRGPTSRFSVTPNDALFTIVPRRAPEPPVIPDVPFDEDDFDTWNLQYPQSGAADYASSSASTSSTQSYPSVSASSSYASTSSYGSSSSSSGSSGPATPADAEHVGPFTLSAKRKNAAMDSDECAVDKRPKYNRKSWARGRKLC
ncbi:hypothetical protein C8R43DRAFT_18949 [Mycena crocata]|nr:hypothetical protein C8R43DRAFT_18949 [Mycena crocata]